MLRLLFTIALIVTLGIPCLRARGDGSGADGGIGGDADTSASSSVDAAASPGASASASSGGSAAGDGFGGFSHDADAISKMGGRGAGPMSQGDPLSGLRGGNADSAPSRGESAGEAERCCGYGAVAVGATALGAATLGFVPSASSILYGGAAACVGCVIEHFFHKRDVDRTEIRQPSERQEKHLRVQEPTKRRYQRLPTF